MLREQLDCFIVGRMLNTGIDSAPEEAGKNRHMRIAHVRFKMVQDRIKQATVDNLSQELLVQARVIADELVDGLKACDKLTLDLQVPCLTE